MADSLGLLREANLEQSQLTEQTTDYVQSTEAGVVNEVVEEPISGLEVEQSMADALGLTRETNLEQSQALDEQQEESMKEGILDSSPVANPNAMNVIVVAPKYGDYSEPKGVGVLKSSSVIVIRYINSGWLVFQGRGPVDDFSLVNLPDHYLDLFKFYDPVGGEHFNIFAAGLKTADRVVTVSHGYAWELKTLEGGWGLHEIISENDWKFRGIVNGISTESWKPNSDVYLTCDGYTNYSVETLQAGKAQCKAALQRELGLPVRGDVPIIAFIGRLDYQKGVDLIAEARPWLVGQDLQIVMLGTGRRDLEDMIRGFESAHRDKARAWIGFSVKMAHRITAGADVLLMPSRFEPCGLNQLYAMMYGTVPVVHSVGGLRDTVQQFDPLNEVGLGWTFERAEANGMIQALQHCLDTYRNHKKSWERLQVRGMIQDLSWDNAAQRYEEVLIAAKYQW
ncbi:hypothetical protein BHE74_00013453 [Ensete ventricosum]|nr:hypothetical protein BHE74_00013453 [Ensete ventricosum]